MRRPWLTGGWLSCQKQTKTNKQIVNKVQTLSDAKCDVSSPAPYADSSQEIGHYCKHHSVFVLGDGDA
jgi:hypothetical protein